MSLDTLIAPLSQPEPAEQQGCALVLMGGGARTAYQVGVLRALGSMLAPRGQAPADHSLSAGPPSPFPFRWLFGTSAQSR